jgi:hypothetical protein
MVDGRVTDIGVVAAVALISTYGIDLAVINCNGCGRGRRRGCLEYACQWHINGVWQKFKLQDEMFMHG